MGDNGWPGKYGRGALVRKTPQREAWKEILFFALLNCLQTVELSIAALDRHKVVVFFFFPNNTDTKQVCTPLGGGLGTLKNYLQVGFKQLLWCLHYLQS